MCSEMDSLWRHLDLHQAEQGQPKYMRLKNCLLAELTAGRLKAGDSLPSEKYLADALGVARNTVRQAMAELEREELICRVPGRGTFVDEDVRRRLAKGLDLFALITPETHTGYYPSLLHGFEMAAKQVDNQTIVCSTNNSVDKQASAILQLLDKRVAGVAMVPTTTPATPAYQIRQLRERGIPVVFCHRRVEGDPAPLVSFSFEEGGRLAGEAAVRQGHRRLAFFAHHRSLSTGACLAGLQRQLQSAGGEVPEKFVYYGPAATPVDLALQEETVRRALQEMLACEDRPTAIMASFDPVAELIYFLLGQMGVRVPEDVSLIGFGGSRRDGPISWRLTSVVVDEVEVGRKAVGLLHEIRSGNRPPDDREEIVMPLNISAGQTLGLAPRLLPERSGSRVLL